MLQIKKGATDRSVDVLIIDSTDGTPETGVVYNTSGIDLWYRRDGGALVSITEATLASLTTAHADGGFLHIAHGVYRLDLPDAAFASGANKVSWGGTVTGMIVIGGEAMLVDYDPQDTVRLGLTALPNAAAGAAGGLPVTTLGSLDLDQIPRPVWQGTLSAIANGSITLPGGHGIDTQAQIVVELLSGTNAKGKSRYAAYSGSGEVWNVDKAWNADSETLPSGTITARIFSVPAEPATNLPRVDVRHWLGSAPNALSSGRVDVTVGAMQANVMTAAAAAADLGTELQSGLATAAALATLAGYVDTEVAAILAAVDTEIAAIKAKTDNLPTDPADASDIAASFASLASSLATLATYVDTEVAAIKAKTDNLPADPADASDVAAAIASLATSLATLTGYVDTEVAAIKAKTDALPSDPADASDIAGAFTSLATSIATLASYVDTEVAAIKAKTDNLPAAPAAVSDIPTAAAIATAVHTTALTEDYSTDGGTVTMSQALYELLGLLSEFSIVGTTMTVKKRDGSTTAFTVTLNDATNPTAITRGT